MKTGDTAYFPGTGPEEKSCFECDHWYCPRTAGRCRKAAEMRRVSVMTLEPIDKYTVACKFFTLRGR